MKPLSSPYLKEIEPRSIFGKLKVLFRFTVATIIVVLVAYGIKSVLGFVTPQIHDQIFLQLKGSLYTKYFPFSLVCLSIFLFLLTYNIFAFVSGKSLVRSAYIWLVRRFLYFPGFGDVVILMARVTSAFGVKPKLLEDIITTDCALCLENLIHSPVHEGQGRRLVLASRLLLKITQLTRPSVSRQLQNVEMLLRSLIVFELRTGGSGSNSYAKKVSVLGLKFIELLKSHEGNTKASEPDEWAYSFRSKDLLGQVAIIFNRPANVGWVSDSLANANEPCPWKGFGQLMQYHHQREKLMNDVWLRVEECFFTNEIESMSEAVDLFDGLVDKAPETVRASGILSHGIALYLSAASGREGIICSYKNSVGALSFCAELIDETDSLLNQCKSNLTHLTASLDEPWTQGLMAEMKKNRMEIRRGDWVGSAFKESQTLTQEDFEYANQQLDSEVMQAGPDFNGASRLACLGSDSVQNSEPSRLP